MTDKSAAELEREAEAARERVANTAESLRSKMTPGQLIDEMTGMFSSGDSSAALNTLKAQVRDNPLPLTLVGAGLAWLMLGQGSGSSRDSEARYGTGERYGAGEYGSREGWDGDYPTSDADLGDYGSAGRGGGSLADKVTSAASSAIQMASEATGSVQQAFSGATDRIGRSAGDFAGRSRGMGSQARHAAEDMFEREPLVLAALGLTVGTAIGALLPHTRLEDEALGKYAGKLRDAGEDLYEKGMKEAKDVATVAYNEVKEAADREGLAGDEQATVAERVGEVVKSVAERTEESVRSKIGSTKER